MTPSRLFGAGGGSIGAPMNTRFLPFLIVSALAALPVAAVAKKPAAAAHATPAAPKKIGDFGDWVAATHQEGGQTVCYAFTRAQTSAPALSGRGPVILTVTERASGRDAVAIEAGLTYAANAAVTVQADRTALEFYTAGRNAFARDGKAAVAAFDKAPRAVARSPAPKEVADTFSLKGFSEAYKAIVKACPAK